MSEVVERVMRVIDAGDHKPPAQFNPGPAPMLQWVSIEQLVIDESYQRELKRGNWTAIHKIAASFRWSRFSPVFVAPVEGGRFAIIDGQHRAHAAVICGVTELPCQVVQMSREEQAASFAAVNGLVTKVTPLQIYRAALVAREDWALACEKACADADCRLMTYKNSTDARRTGEIYAPTLIRSYVDRGRAEDLTYALAALRHSEIGVEPTVWNISVLKPWLMAVTDRSWLRQRDADLKQFLDDFDIWAAIDQAETFVREKRRQGVIDISRWDIAAAQIGEALDRAFVRRMAAAGSAS